MHKRIGVAALAVAAAVGFGPAAAGPPLARDAALELMARPGSWIEADGTLLPDGTLQAKDLEIYAAGHPELEDAALNGAVTSLNRAKSTMRVLGYTVVWDAQTTLKDENKRQILSSKIQEGMGVKVQGSLQPNGTFKATKIKLQAAKVVNGKAKVKEKIFGPVTVKDARGGFLRVLDTQVALREDATFLEVPATPAPTP